MNETTRLELDFANELGKNQRISIRKPVPGLTETEILPVMELIVEKNIFSDGGLDPYVEATSARYVRTSVEEVFEA